MEELKVKKTHWITLTAGIAIVLGIYTVPAITQTQPAAAPSVPYLVAVIDVAQVIKSHPDFVTKQNALQEEVKRAEAEFGDRQKIIANKQKGLEGLKNNTPEYQKLYEEIANDLAEIEKDAKARQRRFILANSQIMFDTYKEIKGTIEKYASARNIAQVTDFREFEVNPADPNTVAEDMDQRLVWYNKRLNITNYILEDIYAVRGKKWDPNTPLPAMTGQPQPLQQASPNLPHMQR